LKTALLAALLTALGPDCNDNGRDDAKDIALGTSADCDGNGVPDECQPCEDCDGDGVLDVCEMDALGGLVGEYWIGDQPGLFSERIVVRIDDQVDFDWGDGAPDPLLPTDDFTVRWTGQVTLPAGGSWTLYTTTDDGVRLWVDDILLIDRWIDQSPTEWSATIGLSAGPHAIRMEYYEAGGGAVASLEWEGPGVARAVIPMSALHPVDDLNGDGWPDGCPDCNGNGVADAQDLLDGLATDCNGNCVPDDCDVMPPPPVGYWRFDLGVDPVVDAGPNGYDGAPAGLAAISEVPVNPVPRTGDPNAVAADLGGAGFFLVNDTDSAFTSDGAPFTFESWVRLDHVSDTSATGQRQYLVQKKGLTDGGSLMDYSILAQGGNIHDSIALNFGKTSGFSGREICLLIGTGGTTWMATSHLEIDDLEWHHVSVALDPVTLRVRFTLDDAVEMVVHDDLGYHANDGPLLVGAHTNAAGQFNQYLRGAIDEVRYSAGVVPVADLLNRLVGADCNDNGIPDSCDIADGTSEDCDEDGVPDECEPDCNDNGVPDSCDIIGGTSEDCNTDGIPDECQLRDNDCDANGVPDDCQLADEDCNGNGIVDSCDIAAGTSEDCLPDGIPDECQLGDERVLVYDDGTAEYGVRADQPFMAWLNGFTVEPGGTTLDAFDVMWIFLPAGTSVDMYVWSDPNGDGVPDDAQVLWTGTTTVSVFNELQRFDIPDIDLGPIGTRFFIGFIVPVTTSDFPGALDTTSAPHPGRSWLVGAESPIPPNDLSSGAIEFRPIEEIIFPGNWVIRAKMLATGNDCNANGIPDDCDIASGLEDDVDGNGVPDACEDCNGNGVPDGLDIDGGLSLDCQGDGVPDECQILSDCDGDGVPDDCADDCNANGVPDACDIASGTSDDADGTGIPDECEDCNGNGVLDSDDIAAGTSDDCEGDGIPDECQFGTPAIDVDYAHDDGTREVNVGVVAPVDIVWLHQMIVEPGAEPGLGQHALGAAGDGPPLERPQSGRRSHGRPGHRDGAHRHAEPADRHVQPRADRPDLRRGGGHVVLRRCALPRRPQHGARGGGQLGAALGRLARVHRHRRPAHRSRRPLVRWRLRARLGQPHGAGRRVRRHASVRLQRERRARRVRHPRRHQRRRRPRRRAGRVPVRGRRRRRRHRRLRRPAPGAGRLGRPVRLPRPARGPRGVGRVPVRPRRLVAVVYGLVSLLLPGTVLAEDCNGNGIDDAIDLAGIDPIAYWRFEEDGGPHLDSGPNGLDGTATDAASITDVPLDPVPRTTEANVRASLPGGSGYVTVAEPDGWLTMGGASFTAEAWVRLDHLSDTGGPNQRQFLLQKKAIAAPGIDLDYAFLVQNGDLFTSVDTNYGKSSGFSGRELVLLFGNGSTTWSVTSHLQVATTGWHHVSVAYDGVAEEVRFGLDATFETIDAPGPGHTANTGPLLIGAHTNSAGTYNQFLRGAVDELRIVDGVAPVDQLLQSYAMADCNGNDVPDGCDIASGLSEDCDANGQPDSCDLVDNDCDGNGVPDQCDPDCNGNGVPDACDIAAGASQDCQPDGIPDDCQLDESFGLFYDNGFANIAWRADEPYMAWLNRFNVVEGAGTVEGIGVLWGIMPVGTQVDVYVWSDPDGDGDPTDAEVLWSDTVTVLQTDSLSEIEVPEVEVGDTGAGFFVGFIMPVTTEFPAALDIHGVPVPDRSWGIGADTPIDPNDLSAGAVEFGTINNLLFGNVWVIRAQMRGVGTDCNGNGIPDDCDIEDGTSADLDGNGLPDECDPDCNDNGTLDGFDIADGTSSDCNVDGVPDECQVAANDCDGDGVPDDCQLEGNDCNENGILDACDIASGYDMDADGSGVPDECEDCNGNGVLDSIDIDMGFSDDCNGDGVPDECQFGDAVATTIYAYDDGVQEANIQFIGGDGFEYAWMNHFTVASGSEWVSAIEVVWGATYPDLPAKVVLWSDPDGDGYPGDAQVIITVETRTMKIDFPLDNLNVVPIPPTYVGPVGTPFFVGVFFHDIWNSGAFIPVDTDDPIDGTGWIAYGPGGSLDLNNLAAGFLLAWPHHDFLVRAVGFDGVLEHDCNANGTIDACDIDGGASADANGNGIPDECECIGDLDGDGFVDFGDLLDLLVAWGTSDADLTGDGVTGFQDLLLLLAAWGACR
jgi:hypothetical protein